MLLKLSSATELSFGAPHGIFYIYIYMDLFIAIFVFKSKISLLKKHIYLLRCLLCVYLFIFQMIYRKTIINHSCCRDIPFFFGGGDDCSDCSGYMHTYQMCPALCSPPSCHRQVQGTLNRQCEMTADGASTGARVHLGYKMVPQFGRATLADSTPRTFRFVILLYIITYLYSFFSPCINISYLCVFIYVYVYIYIFTN